MEENKNEMNPEEMTPQDVPLNEQEPLPQMPLTDDVAEPTFSKETLKKKRVAKKPAIIAAISVIAVSCLLLVCLAMGLFTPQDPWEKTMEAVFPTFSILESMTTGGGRVSVDATIASDLSDRVDKEPVQLHAEAALGQGGLQVSGSLGSRQHAVDLGVVVDKKGAQIYSDRLLDGGYSVAFKGLLEAIDQSIFAPDSGTDYALPKEIYDWIEEYVNKFDDPDEDVLEFEEIEKVLERMIKEIRKTAEVTQEDMTLSLIDADTKAQVTILTLDSEAIVIARDILVEAWDNNTDFYQELRDLFRAYVVSTDGEEVDTDDVLKALYEQLKTALDEYIELAEQNNFALELTYGMRGGYLIYASVDARMEVEVDKKGNRETTGITLSWTFSSRPSRDPSYDIVLLAYSGDERDKPLIVSHRQEGTRFTFTVDTENHDLTVKGTYLTGMSKAVLSVEDFLWTVDGKTKFEMTESVITLTVEKGNQKIKRATDDKNLLSMTAADMDVLGDRIEQEIDAFSAEVNRDLGFELIYETLAHRQQSYMILPESAYDYAYDQTNGHLFLATMKGGKHYVLMYDIETMEQLAEVKVRREVLAMDADGGYLAITDLTYPENDTDNIMLVDIYDSATLSLIKTLDMNQYARFFYQYSGDLIVDETRLIYATGNQHCDILFVDIETEQLISMTQSSVYRPYLAIDRENHVVAAVECGISTSELIMYDSVTGEFIKCGKKKGSYNSNAPYFDGVSFQAFGYHFLTDGTEVATTKLVTERHYKDREDELLALVYKNADILVTLEQDSLGAYYTMFYRLTGEKQQSPLFEKLEGQMYTEMIKVGENAYLAISYTDEYGAIEYFTIEPSKDIGF